jgi:hypothetical protein
VPVIAKTPEGRKVSVVTVAGPSSYATGGFIVTVGDLSRIDAVLSATISGGYKVRSTSVSGNKVTVAVDYFDYGATDAGPAIQVPAGTNLSAQTITLITMGT